MALGRSLAAADAIEDPDDESYSVELRGNEGACDPGGGSLRSLWPWTTKHGAFCVETVGLGIERSRHVGLA
jgi:hypothetical protein